MERLALFGAILVLLVSSPAPAAGLTPDGVLLLSFKYSLLSDPFAALADWSYADDTPCGWNGVVCTPVPAAAPAMSVPRVISLVLPNMQLAGPVAPELGLVEHLRHLDLSGNALNGSLPDELFGAPDLRVLSLANNDIAGRLPELVGQLTNLRALNLAGNALSGEIPANLSLLPNLTAVSLAANYFSGELPAAGGFASVQVFDVSGNLLNGSLPPELFGKALRYANFSNNHFAGGIPAGMAKRIPANATVDFSFNGFSGPIPAASVLLAQRPSAFAGNPGLCGRPLRSLCTVPSTLSDPPLTRPSSSSEASSNVTDSPPALAALPQNTNVSYPVRGSGGGGGGGDSSSKQGGMRLATILAIAVGDIAGVCVLAVVFLYVYQVKRKRQERILAAAAAKKTVTAPPPPAPEPDSSPEAGHGFACFFTKKDGAGGGRDDNASETSSCTSTEQKAAPATAAAAAARCKQTEEKGLLVTVDGGAPELELETLLKASAFILGAAESSIVYKAVLADGSALAVRRIGAEGSLEKLKDFEAQARAIARLRHPNILRLRGFYWGAEEKLLIHDYAANGSLATVMLRRKPAGLGWEARMRIARGVARGLAYLHDKKCVHGNVKPSNILVGDDMEPMLGDLGLDRLASRQASSGNVGASFRQFGSKRSARSLPELSPAAQSGASPAPSPSSLRNPYLAPEGLKAALKPTAKWDVYGFGMVLLELVAGRVFTEVEVCQWSAGFPPEEKDRVPRMADAALRGEIEGKEEMVYGCFKLGFSCCAMAPQKRPAMKDALLLLEKMDPSSSAPSTSSAV